jgi:hypothetical protein
MADQEPMSPEYKRLVEEVKKDAGLIGCGCGRFAMSRKTEQYLDDGVVHRPNRPCYREGASKQAGPPMRTT